MKSAERIRLERELIEYYDCPRHLVDEVADYCEADPGRSPAEYVEAAIEADQA